MKIGNKLIFILLIIFVAICTFSINNIVYAEDDLGPRKISPTENPGFYAPDSGTDASGADTLNKIGNTIVGVIQLVGTIVSVAVLAIIGIKYMIGSAEEKAEYKKTMVPYLIGAIMLFAITNILKIIVNIANSLF